MDNLVCNSSLRALGVEGERITWPWPIDQSYGRVYSLSGETLFIGTLPRRQPVAINFGVTVPPKVAVTVQAPADWPTSTTSS